MKTDILQESKLRSTRRRTIRWVAAATMLSVTSVSYAADAAPKRPKRLPAVQPKASEVSAAKLSSATDQDGWSDADMLNCSARILTKSPRIVRVDTQPEVQPPVTPTRWLRSTTSSAASEVARRLITQASQEYNVGAWLSAETTAWDGLQWAAEAIDLANREHGENAVSKSQSNLARLQRARDAIREARDFSGKYGVLDADAIARMARSHVTDLLDNQPTNGLTANDASDLYLDAARVELAPIAKQSVEAAQAMDLLAAIYLTRADAKTLPSATALSLRRAALQGQPKNASLASRLGSHLADVGLLEEARWALEHSLSIEHDAETAEALVTVLRRVGEGDDAAQLLALIQSRAAGQPSDVPSQPRRPTIMELSPEEFAAISPPTMPLNGGTNLSAASIEPINSTVARATVQPASARLPNSSEASSDSSDDNPGMVRRFMKSIKRVW